MSIMSIVSIGAHSIMRPIAFILVFGSVLLPTAATAGYTAPGAAPPWVDGYRLRYTLRVACDPYVQPARTVIASIPSGWIKPDAEGMVQVVVQSQSGQVMPCMIVSYKPDGNTLVRFARSGNDQWYWAYVLPRDGVRPPVLRGPDAEQAVADLLLGREGLTLELRQWDGNEPDDWQAVDDAIVQPLAGTVERTPPPIIGNAVLGQIAMSGNPSRPRDHRHFAAIYHGWLNVTKPGSYRMFVNGHGASFVFIDGRIVCRQPGQNRPVGRAPIDTTGEQVDLQAGIHSIKLYNVVGRNPDSYSSCLLLWLPPGERKWVRVPREAFVPAMFASATGVETYGGGQAAQFIWGIDDVFKLERMSIYLVRFEAVGQIRNPDGLVWDLGDGTPGRGRTLRHIYTAEDDYTVSLKSSDDLPPFAAPVQVWAAPVPSSPYSLSAAVDIVSQMDLEKLKPQRLHELFGFLLICEQPERWPVLDRIAELLLKQPDLDSETRMQLCSTRMEALAVAGRAADGIALAAGMLDEFAKIAPLRARLTLAIADVYRDYVHDFDKARQFYEKLIEEYRRLNDPVIREAAIHLGDMLADTGDLEPARKAYRAAATFGGSAFDSSAQQNAIAQGAMLRIAEQSLKSGNIRQTYRLIQQIELKFPEQRLGGICRFIRAETERQFGRHEQAIRNYELLLNLLNWSGFRDQSIFGIADCNARMHNYTEALKWLDLLRQTFPKYYEENKLDAYEQALTDRRRREDGKMGGRGDGKFAIDFERTTDFESAPIGFLPAMGIDGPTVGLMEAQRSEGTPGVESFRLRLDRRRLAMARAGDRYWLEFWYRDMVGTGTLQAGSATNVQMFYHRATPPQGPQQVRAEFGYGQWRKTGMIVQVPYDSECVQEIQFDATGVLEIDGLKMLPVTDRQYGALLNFMEEEQQEE